MESQKKRCVPCEKGTKAMDEATAKVKLSKLSGWELADAGKAICRKVKLKNWKQAFALVSRIDKVAEAEGHHPDISFGWGYCNITLTTHSAGGLHENDFVMAEKINGLIEQK